MSKSFLRKSFNQTMRSVTRLTGKGRLMDATRLIQQALSGFNAAPTPPSQGPVFRPTGTPTDDITDVVIKPVAKLAPAANDAHAEPVAEPLASPAPAQPHSVVAQVEAELTEAFKHAFVPDLLPKEPDSPEAPTVSPTAPVPSVEPSFKPTARPAAFTEGVTQFKGDPYPYRLYVPAGRNIADTADTAAGPVRLPLVLLLHGCKQNALDFATGTAMNALADEHQVMVLYPEQLPKANGGRCWNWFEPVHQTRSGEPGMIAALTRKIASASYGDVQVDPERIYIAGLSAGGAMAAVTAGLYPELFAAMGVHSGLPAGAASNMMAAFGAMRSGSAGRAVSAMPTIVFHGSGDQTVHPDNGDNVTDAAVAALKASGLKLQKSAQGVRSKGERAAQRTTYTDASDKPYVEHWSVHAAPHAWSGGDAKGSYTDPDGPSASEAMLKFFLQHKKA